MTKPSQEVEKIEQLLADPWAVDIEELWQQAAHNPDKDLRKRITSTSRRYFNAMRNNDGKHEPVKNAENYLYGCTALCKTCLAFGGTNKPMKNTGQHTQITSRCHISSYKLV